MGIPPKVVVPTTKVRWIKNINTHRAGDIEDVSTARLKNLLAGGLVELYPPKVEKKAKPKVKPTVEVATAAPEAESAEVSPVEVKRPHPLTRSKAK